MFGKGREVALDGLPSVDGLFLLLCDVDQRFMPAVPDGRELRRVKTEKAQSSRLP